MELKVYADRMSQPSRAILIFCKMNGIEFEEIKIELSKGEHKSPEYKEINPMGQVPAIVHGDVKLFESHAILTYLASAFPGVSDHWYPADLVKRAKVQSVLDWHHSNLRRGSVMYLLNTVFGPVFGLTPNPQAAAEAEKILSSSLSIIESYWLEEEGKFLLGGLQPSLADLCLVCEIMESELIDEKDRTRIFGPFKKVHEWIQNTKTATSPHFEEVHETLYGVKARFQEPRAVDGSKEQRV